MQQPTKIFLTVFILLGSPQPASADSLSLLCKGLYYGKLLTVMAFFPVLDNPSDGSGRIILNSNGVIENKTMRTNHFFAQGMSEYTWFTEHGGRVTIDDDAGKFSIFTSGLVSLSFLKRNPSNGLNENIQLSGDHINCQSAFGDNGVQNFNSLSN